MILGLAKIIRSFLIFETLCSQNKRGWHGPMGAFAFFEPGKTNQIKIFISNKKEKRHAEELSKMVAEQEIVMEAERNQRIEIEKFEESRVLAQKEMEKLQTSLKDSD